MTTPTVIIFALIGLAFYLGAYLHGHYEGVSETEARWSEAVTKADARRAALNERERAQ